MAETVEAATRRNLVRHFRSVAFAALNADVPVSELEEALQTAVTARARQQENLPPRPRLTLVR